MGNGKFLIVGGFFDGRINVFNIELEKLAFIINDLNESVSAITTDKKENILLVGSKSGELHIYKIFYNLDEINFKL